jgi:hypothetical protein
MKFTNALKDEDMRKQAATEVDAELSIARDYALAKAAAEAHPDWENLPDGSLRHIGRDWPRGPRRVHTLIKWFKETRPMEARRVWSSVMLDD